MSKVTRALYISLLAAAVMIPPAVAQIEPTSEPHKVVEFKEKYIPAKPSGLSKRGAQLYGQFKCAACHSINLKGGCLAPPLDGVGGHRSSDYLLLRLSGASGDEDAFIKLIGHPELLEHPRFPRKDVDALAAYLQTIPARKEPYAIGIHTLPRDVHDDPVDPAFKPLAPTASSQQGKHIFSDQGCAMCHSIGQIGGWFAPRLDGVGGRHSRAYIEAMIANPQPRDKDSARMPKIKLTPEEVKQLTDYLLTLPVMP